MALKEVAVDDATLTVQAPVTRSASWIDPSSTKVKGEGDGFHLDQDQVQVAVGATDGTCTTTVPGTGNMPATATKVKETDSDKLVLRVDDEVTVSAITGVTMVPGPCTLDVTVKITAAGQNKVLAQ